MLVLDALSDVQHVQLCEAFAALLVLVDANDWRYERAAKRFTERAVGELGLSLADMTLLTVALSLLPASELAVTAERVALLLEGFGTRDAQREFEEWRARRASRSERP